MKFFIWLCLLLFFCLPGHAQATNPAEACKIRGRVIDSVTNLPVGYAAVTAFLKGSTNVAGGMITDEQGRFSIDHLAPGDYQVKVDFIGYNTIIKTGVILSAGQPAARMGDISITGSATTIKDVTITGARNFMENKLDKFVYNVDKDITSQNGVATDLLKKIPQISVDVDGNVELLGSSNVRVFINGKASAMFDNNLAEALQAIPASEIKSIEVITTPGAQYDAQGSGGIINIILKDNKSQGINGSVNVSAGTRLENGTATIHAHKNNFDINASLGTNDHLKSSTLSSMDRRTDGDTSELKQNGNGTDTRTSYKGQTGMDWAISKKDDLNASLRYNNYGDQQTGYIYQQQLSYYPATDTNSLKNSNSYFRYRVTDFNINYVRKMDSSSQELDLSYQLSYCRYNAYYQQNQLYEGSANAFAGGEGNNRKKDYETYIIADYTLPITKNIIFNTGVKGSFTREYSYSDNYLLDAQSGDYNFNPAGLDYFNYIRSVYAAYVSLTLPLGDKNSLKLGMRDEYTNVTLPADTTNPSYNFFIPSAVISRKLANNQTLKLSYTKRLQRANYQVLDPFVNAADPSNLTEGNPYLKPERSDVAELSYFKFFNSGSSFLATLYYRNTRDDEQTYILSYDSININNITYRNVTITTNENAGNQQTTGINLSGTLALSQKLEIRGSANLYDKYIVSTLIPGNSINAFNYRINANATYKFNKDLAAEFFGNFNSPRTEIQGAFPSFTSYSVAIRQMLHHNKASIAFTTTNPFNKYVDQPTNISGPGFTIAADRKLPYRSFGLSFTYKFGKMEGKEKKEEKNEEDEARER
jgi:ferric enterobactin receptor